MSSNIPRSARPSRQRPDVPVDGCDLFTYSEAQASGWTADALSHSIAARRTVRVKRGVYSPAPDPITSGADPSTGRSNLLLARATARLCARAAVSHASAAIAHRLPTACALERPCLTVPPGAALRRLSQVHLHRATLNHRDLVDVGGIATTSPARTVLDLAREHGVDAGVVAADAALRAGSTTATELEQALGQCATWPGRSAARATVRLCDAGSESALESLSRLRMVRFAVPTPELQVAIGDEWGRFLARVDFYWGEFGVVGEADGNAKYDGRAALIAERRRQARLEDLGLVVVRWEWRDLARFDAVARRLQSAHARGTRRGQGQRWSTLPAHPPVCIRSPD